MNYRQRRQMRIKNFSYSAPGVYFVTICSYHRISFFGDITNDDIGLSEIGIVIDKAWRKIESMYHNVTLDAFVIMPNHFHGILLINGAGAFKKASGNIIETSPDDIKEGAPALLSVSDIIHDFKSFTAHSHYLKKKQLLWQRGFYEHIIRENSELKNVREYIQNNIANWNYDKYKDPDETCTIRNLPEYM